MSKHEGDFEAMVRRLAVDHAKRSDANGEAQKASAASRRDFLVAFEEKARTEVEPILEQAAEVLAESGNVKASAELSDDNERLELSVTARDRGAGRDRVHKLVFLADSLKRRVTVHAGSYLLQEINEALSEMRRIAQGETPALATLTLDQLDGDEVRGHVERFLREALR